ncbi:MAG TPA: type I restriction endonuclease subunit S [Ruminococcaceae bacterium]|nr:type I restriction endonuclease subunit S [Oscillospiraceae bacterium]
MMGNTKKPAIRFKGFTGDWEERELSSVFCRIGDGLHGTPKCSDSGDAYFINGNNLRDGHIVITDDTKRVDSVDLSDDDRGLDTNTFLYSINGTIGNMAWYTGEKIMLGKSAAYLTPKNFHRLFSYYLIQSESVFNHFLNNLTGTTIRNLGLKTIRDTPVVVPGASEQEGIGHFFKLLDDTITLQQQKLKKLQNVKKSMLEKMFI